MPRREPTRKEIELKNYIDSLLDRTFRLLKAKVPKNEYPNVVIKNDLVRSYYDSLDNTAYLREDDANSIDAIGEEIVGHFPRLKLREYAMQREPTGLNAYLERVFGKKQKPIQQEKPEKHVDEFFGYLGRRIIREIAKPEDNLKKHSQIKPEIKNQKFKGRYVAEHKRPYAFAEQIDLDKLDLPKLYTLPNQEIRYRFFRIDPQYNLNKPIQPGKITKRKKGETGLEKIIKIIGIAGIFILFILSINTKNLTGYVIDIANNPINLNSIALIAIVLLIIAISINYKKSRT